MCLGKYLFVSLRSNTILLILLPNWKNVVQTGLHQPTETDSTVLQRARNYFKECGVLWCIAWWKCSPVKYYFSVFTELVIKGIYTAKGEMIE